MADGPQNPGDSDAPQFGKPKRLSRPDKSAPGKSVASAAKKIGSKSLGKAGEGSLSKLASKSLGDTGNKTDRQMKKTNAKRAAKGKAPKKQGAATTAANAAMTKSAGAALTAATGGVIPPAVADKLAAIGVRNKKKLIVATVLASTPIPLMLTILILIFALGFAGLPSFAIAPSTQATSQIKEDYLNAYQQAGNDNQVPWTILAAIGQVATQNGTVNPYASTSGTTDCGNGKTVSGQAECTSFPEVSPPIVPPTSGSTTAQGVGPMMIDQSQAENITHGNPQSVLASADGIAQLLSKNGQAIATKEGVSYQTMLTNPLTKEAKYWSQAVAALPISIGDDCLPPTTGTTPFSTSTPTGGSLGPSDVATAIEYVFSCEATTATDLTLGVGNGVTIPSNDAQNQIVAEGLEVSWAYSKMGSVAGNCNPFPVVPNVVNADCNAAGGGSQEKAQLNNIQATAKSVIAHALVSSANGGSQMASSDWSVVANPSAVVAPPSPTPPTPTTKPSGLSAAQGDGQIAISWTPATDFDGAPVASYEVTTSGNKSCTAVGASATSCTVYKLTNGTNYTFTVKAKNTSGKLSAPALIGPIQPTTSPAVDSTSNGWGAAAPPTQQCEATLMTDLNGVATNPFSPTGPSSYKDTWNAGALEALRNNPQSGCFIPSQAANRPGQVVSEQRWDLIVVTAAFQVLGERWVAQGAQVSEGGIQTLIVYLESQLQGTPYALKPIVPGQTSLLPRQSNPTVEFPLPLSGQDGAVQVVPLASVPVGTTGFTSNVLSTAEGYDIRTAGSATGSGAALACGPMTEYTWSALVMEDAGITPTVANTTAMAVWIVQENPITDWYRAGSNNPLNVNRSGSGSDSTPNLTFNAKDTAAVLKQANMANVYAALKKSNMKAFSVAITTSNWAESHYRVDTHDPSVPLPPGVQPWSGPLDTMGSPFEFVPGRLDTYMATYPAPAPVVAPPSAVGPPLPACTGATGSAAAVVAAALSVYTSPYAPAQGPPGVAGYDCSGLVDWSLLQAGGLGLPGDLGGGAKSGTAANQHGITTEGMASQWANKVQPPGTQPQAGDIILYFNLDGDSAWDHVALALGDGLAVAETGPTGSPGSIGPYTWPGAVTEVIRP